LFLIPPPPVPRYRPEGLILWDRDFSLSSVRPNRFFFLGLLYFLSGAALPTTSPAISCATAYAVCRGFYFSTEGTLSEMGVFPECKRFVGPFFSQPDGCRLRWFSFVNHLIPFTNLSSSSFRAFPAFLFPRPPLFSSAEFS